MLGQGVLYAKSNNSQRQRIDIESPVKVNVIDKLIIKNKKMNELSRKYFNKIIDCVIKAIQLDKNSVVFYYNYYDLINERIGKPHGLLNEFMYEMCYDFSNYLNKDINGNPMTFKTIFGDNFRWEMRGKNNILLLW